MVTVKFKLLFLGGEHFLEVLKLLCLRPLVQLPLFGSDGAFTVVQSKLKQIQFDFLTFFYSVGVYFLVLVLGLS